MRTIALTLATLTLAGCSIKQNVTPATLEAAPSKEICMIPAAGLRPGFHNVYRDLLTQKGFTVRELHSSASPSLCQLSTTYTGTWRWDLALYLEIADIKVYQRGKQIGHASYDSSWGGGRLDKFISAENKITELVNQLFPNGAPAVIASQARPTDATAQGAMSREQWTQQQLEQLNREGLSYEEYQRRYREITGQ